MTLHGSVIKSHKTKHTKTENPGNKKQKAKEGKREAKQAQITAGKELASKLFSATTTRTSTNLLHERDSAEESALRGPKKKQNL